MASSSQTLAKLDFKEALVQQGKRETTDTLLKRLKTLRQKLSVLEQDATDTKSLDPVRKPLIHQTILHHKDRGVRAYAACCLADLLKLYAPDAPYSDVQLRDIFQFFHTQITQNLRPTTSHARPQGKNKAPDASQTTLNQRITDIPYYPDYYYLIESLATIKSIVLICDVPGAEELMDGFFSGFIEIARPDMSKTLMRYMRDVLVSIIEEASTLPQGVMDSIINEFVQHSSKPETPSFQLIVDVCNEVADKLKHPFYAHFSQIQLDHGVDPSPNDLKILSQSHDLLLTINRFCPDTLLLAVPRLEENLQAADEVPLRSLSTRTLGHLFAQRAGAGGAGTSGDDNPAKKYPSTWRAWLTKQVDKAVPVRLAWVETTRGILVNHPAVRQQLEDAMVGRLADPDEKVRGTMSRVLGSLDYETALHHVQPKTLRALGDRILDKRSSVRSEALSALAKLWESAFSEIEAGDDGAIKQFGWIPQAIIAAILKGELPMDMRAQIISVFKKSILPLPADGDDDEDWVDKFLLVASTLDEHAQNGLINLTNLRGIAEGTYPFAAFAEFCEKYQGGMSDSPTDLKPQMNYLVQAVSTKVFGDSQQARKHIQAFVDLNEPRLYKLYRTCVDFSSSLATIIKARNEFLRRVHQSHEDLLPVLTVLLDNSAFDLINHSSIPTLLMRLQKPDSAKRAATACRFLVVIAKECAPMYKTHVAELVACISDKKNTKLVEVALQGLAAVSKVYPDVAPSESRLIERVIKLGYEGTYRQGKFAARFLGKIQNSDLNCGKLIDAILKAIDYTEEGAYEKHLTYLTAFTELARASPKTFTAKVKEIIKYVLDEIMLQPSPSQEVDGDEWVNIDELESLDHAKIIGLRLFTSYCLTFVKDPEAEELLKPALNLLTSVLGNDGMVDQNTAEGGPARCHMRLRAALCLHKLAQAPRFEKIITAPDKFELIGGCVQDPCFMVRNIWLKKLQKNLKYQTISPKWNIIPALAAMDPDQDNIIIAKSILTNIPRRCKQKPADVRIQHIELPFSRLILHLAHHPDLRWHEADADEEDNEDDEDDDETEKKPKVQEGITDIQNLQEIARFIELYLDCLSHKDNIGLFYYIAGQIKSFRDRFRENNKPLYALSELAQLIIRNRAEKHQWPLQVYNNRIALPKDLFHRPDNPEERAKTQKTQFLSEEARAWAKSLGKRAIGGLNVRRPTDSNASPRKRHQTARKVGAPRKKRRVDTSDEDSDGSSSAAESDVETIVGDVARESGDDEDDEAVMGRGGRRGAKTKARNIANKKKNKAGKKSEGANAKSDQMDVDGSS
ncbi:hypothetical protein B9479_007542 [Cryptococcus floricola]|uniref:Sister chromatid cohesion protein n=1 Tax=Cryptococcus floricola TaxID=2591691 RepID=A0A5D3ANE6_9TREE|nr:hypothetical protein B9479_007542 [Cryptococcus floricola]